MQCKRMFFITALSSLFLIHSTSAQYQILSPLRSTMISVNPAFAGSNVCPFFGTTYQLQNDGHHNLGHTAELNFDSQIRPLAGGIGVTLSYDKTRGENWNMSTGLMYAYRFVISRRLVLNAALKAGYRFTNLDAANLSDRYNFTQNAILPSSISSSKGAFTLGAGILAYSGNWFTGFSVDHINRPAEATSNGKKMKLPLRYSAQFGMIGNLWNGKISPVLIWNYQNHRFFNDSANQWMLDATQNVALDLSFSKGRMLGGLGLDYVFGHSFMYHVNAGVQISIIKLNYNFGFAPYKSGDHTSLAQTHQISIGFNFNCHPAHKRSRSISCPSFGSTTRFLGSSYEVLSPERKASDKPASVKQGTLTAGQINDFGKWNLWQDLTKDELSEHRKNWRIQPENRYTVQVVTKERRPVADCSVELLAENGDSKWVSKTDNTGKAELWANLFKTTSNENYKIRIIYDGVSYSYDHISPFDQGINILEIPVECRVPDVLDIVFVIDATGSMQDEIEYLKAELSGLALDVQKNNPGLKLNMGVVLYRDFGDDFVTKKFDLTSDIAGLVKFIAANNADGGGDYEEAMDVALNAAVNDFSWSNQAVNRLLFLVSDAPPHSTDEVRNKLEKVITNASEKGIRLIPVGASGINKSTEYLMRSMALATNGTYVFLTDNSGVGDAHIKPSTDSYDVEFFNKLLYRLILQYSRMSDCDSDTPWSKEELNDTTYVKIIEHVVIDRNSKDSVQTTPPEIIVGIDSVSNQNIADEESSAKIVIVEKSFKFYPNPTTAKLTIEITGDIKELYLADLNGKLLQKFDVGGRSILEIDISRFPPGMYLLVYDNNGTTSSGKILLMP